VSGQNLLEECLAKGTRAPGDQDRGFIND